MKKKSYLHHEFIFQIMKKLLLFLFISNLSIAQSHIEVRLVNANIGAPSCNYFFNDWMCNSTNDTGLNTILSNHGVSYFKQIEGHPYLPYQSRILTIGYSSNDAQLVADLTAYSSVIDNAVITSSDGFSDALYVTLDNYNIGIPIGTSGNIIVTNDTGLNQIFQSYNVFQYSLTAPGYSQFQNLYTLVCDCDAVALKAVLDSYNAIVVNSGYIQGVMLSNNQFEAPKAIVSPNPFTDIINIATEQSITNYTIVDITGKIIVTTDSKSELDVTTTKLNSGIYILNLQFENGQIELQKLVKK